MAQNKISWQWYGYNRLSWGFNYGQCLCWRTRKLFLHSQAGFSAKKLLLLKLQSRLRYEGCAGIAVLNWSLKLNKEEGQRRMSNSALIFAKKIDDSTSQKRTFWKSDAQMVSRKDLCTNWAEKSINLSWRAVEQAGRKGCLPGWDLQSTGCGLWGDRLSFPFENVCYELPSLSAWRTQEYGGCPYCGRILFYEISKHILMFRYGKHLFIELLLKTEDKRWR